MGIDRGRGSTFEQPGSHQISKPQGEQARTAVVSGDAQQQVGGHRGKELQANGILGSTEKSADLQMLFDPAKQQLNLPAFAIEPGDLAGCALEIVGQDGQQAAIVAAR